MSANEAGGRAGGCQRQVVRGRSQEKRERAQALAAAGRRARAIAAAETRLHQVLAHVAASAASARRRQCALPARLSRRRQRDPRQRENGLGASHHRPLEPFRLWPRPLHVGLLRVRE
jgi:hypothetical protein